MKYLLLFILLLGVVSAEEFGAGETVQLYFEEEFSSEDVHLYYNSTSLVDINPIVKEIDGVNILYFDLPLESSLGMYYLDVGNVTFGVVESENVMRISPVYYVFEKSSGSFYLELTSVKGDFDVYVNGTNVEPRKGMVSLSEGETKKLYVDYENISEDGSLELSYGNLSYIIKLFYLDEEEVVEIEVVDVIEEVVEIEVVDEEKVPLTFLVTSSYVNLSLVYNQSVAGTLKVQNTFGERLENLGYELVGDVSNIVSFNMEIVDLDAGGIYETDFIFNKNENATIGIYTGEIVFGNEEHKISIPVVVNVNGYIVEAEEEEIVFGDEIIFEGEILKEEEGNGVLVIGIILIVLMVFFIGVVVLKLRQKQEKRFNEYIEETKKKR